MTYIESNIKRQMAYYDKLYEIGGRDVINDVWVRADGEREWWFVGKIARVSGEFDTMYMISFNFALYNTSMDLFGYTMSLGSGN